MPQSSQGLDAHIVQANASTQPLVSIKLDQIFHLDPQIAIAVSGRKQQAAGVPRDQIHVPISPVPAVTDTLLFESAADGAQKFFLPRYRLATQLVSGRQQYRISLQEHAPNWQLELFLEAFPAPELGESFRTAQKLSHDLTVLLRYQIAGSGAQKELPFGEVSQSDGGAHAVLTVTSLGERDELYQAMTSERYDSTLVVRRRIQVAIPTDETGTTLSATEAVLGGEITAIAAGLLPLYQRPEVLAASQVGAQGLEGRVVLARKVGPIEPPPVIIRPLPRPTPIALPVPQLVLKGSEEYEAGGRQWVRYLLSVTNASSYAEELFAPAPKLPPCGRNTNASRTWVDILTGDGSRLYGFCALGSARNLDSLWFAIERGQRPPDSVYITLNDRQTNRTVRSAAVAIPPPPTVPTFLETTSELDVAVDPFCFPPALHGYIYQGVTPGTGQELGLIRWQVRWKNVFYSYFQEQARSYLFYYLPDSFRFARRPEDNHGPLLSVRIRSADGTDSGTEVTLAYVAVPFVDEDRLATATTELRPHIPHSAGSDLVFQPLSTANTRFVLERPRATGAVVEERPTASLALRSGIHDTLTMPLDDFQPLFDAMMGNGVGMFGGKVVAKISGWPDEEVPFDGRFSQAVGDLFDYNAVQNGDGNEVTATLTNAIESPLRIDGLVAKLNRGADGVPATIRGIGLPIANLAPGESISVVVAATTSPAGSGALTAEFDLSQVRVIVDNEAIWNAVLERSSLEYYRNVTVEAEPTLFEPLPDKPENQITAIYVDFDQGSTARLTAAEPRATVQVDYPINDVILQRPIDAWYSYWVAIQRKSGDVEHDEQARTGRAAIFAVDVVK